MNVHEFLTQWKALRKEEEKKPILHITYVKKGCLISHSKN